MFPWYLIFLKRSLVFPILLFSSISFHWSLRKAFLSLHDSLWNSEFKWEYLSLSPLLFASLFFTTIWVQPKRKKEKQWTGGQAFKGHCSNRTMTLTIPRPKQAWGNFILCVWRVKSEVRGNWVMGMSGPSQSTVVCFVVGLADVSCSFNL